MATEYRLSYTADEIDERLGTVNDNKQAITNLTSRVVQNENDIDVLESKATAIEKDIENLETSIDEDIKTLESSISTNGTNIETLNGKVTANETAISTLNSELFVLNGHKQIKAKTHLEERVVNIPPYQNILIEIDISNYNASLILYSIAQVTGGLSAVFDVNNSTKNVLKFYIFNESSNVYDGGIYPYILTFFV